MDPSVVIQLSCQAAESVFRFRSIAFTKRPTLDLKEFRDIITKEIMKAAKENHHPFKIPLAEVVNYAGIGADEAALQWNDLNGKQNPVAIEWFRNCVCSLVSGVVTDIASTAFTDLKVDASMYLQLDKYNPFEEPVRSAAVPVQQPSPAQQPLPSAPGVGNVDSRAGRAETEQAGDDDVFPVPRPGADTSAANPTSSEAHPHLHEAEKQPAANLVASGARAETITTNKRPFNVPEPSGGSVSHESLPSRPAKRTRLPDAAPARPSTTASSVGAKASSSLGNRAPKRRTFATWTQDELDIVREARARGESWDAIQSMVPRHTNHACQTKYQHILGNKARSTAKRKAAMAARLAQKSNPRGGGLSKGDEDQELEDAESEEEIQDSRGTTTTASPSHRSGFKAINHGFLDN